MKVKTPEELAKESSQKTKFTLYLNKTYMDEINRLANRANTSSSKIVNEAIAAYLTMIKNK